MEAPMKRFPAPWIRVFVLVTILAAAGGCGERKGNTTFETMLDGTLDNYVHPIERAHLDLSSEPPENVKGLDALKGESFGFAEMVLGNLQQRFAIALVEGPGGREVVLDLNLDRDLSNDESFPLHPYREGSTYFESDTLVVAFHVDTGGEQHVVERELYFGHRRTDKGAWVRYYFVGHRVGQFDLGAGGSFGFILFDGDNNGFYDHRDILVIDTNRDGVIDGNRNSVERYLMSEPFLLGERGYRVLGVNRRGIRLSIMPYDEEFTPRDRLEVGDLAPDFALKTPSGTEVSLGQHLGKTVILPYWASW
jgi:hypothetical protein